MKRFKICIVVSFLLIIVLQVAGTVYLNNRIRRIAKYEKEVIESVQNFKNEFLRVQIDGVIADRKDDMRKFYVSDGYQDDSAYIAHGGGIRQFTYTNSMEAVKNSIERNFKFIEVDMIKTSDNKIIGGHDWSYFSKIANVSKNSVKSGGVLSSEEVFGLKIEGAMSPIFGSDINKIMNENSDFVLVTDKISDYEILLKEIPHPDRMIVEVFSPEDYLRALRSGIKYPAYCVWTPSHLEVAKNFGFPIVTMDANNFFRNQETIQMVQDLHDSGVTILLFWTAFPDRDNPEWLKKYLGRTVSKIYTDKWAPNEKPE